MPRCHPSFLAGASMTYFFILPYSLAFTIEFTPSISLDLASIAPRPATTIAGDLDDFAVGIAFQDPLVLVLLVKIGFYPLKSFAITVARTCDPPDLSSLHNPRSDPVTFVF